MNINLKMLFISLVFVFSSNIFAATSVPVDADATVYNAINALCTDSAISALDSTGATSLMSLLNSAVTFYQSPDAPQLANIQSFITKVQAQIDKLSAASALAQVQTAARTALSAAVAATDFTTLISKINDTNFMSQFSWLKTNAASDLSSLYTKVSGMYKGLTTQTKDTLAAYLDGLKSFSNSVKTNTTAFGDQAAISSYADAVIANSDAAKGVVAIVGADLSTPDKLKAVIDANVAAAKAWRNIKSKMPQ